MTVELDNVVAVQRGLDVGGDRGPVLHRQPEPCQLLDLLTQFGLGGGELVEQFTLLGECEGLSAPMRGCVARCGGWPNDPPHVCRDFAHCSRGRGDDGWRGSRVAVLARFPDWR